MDESFLLVSDVHEGSVEGGHNLFDTAEIDISYGERVPCAGLCVVLYQLMVFQQSQPDLFGSHIYNQVFC